MTNPLSTATPDNAMKPTPAEIDSGMPRSARATTPPVSANGTPLNTMAASFAEPNAQNNSAKMMASVTGTTTANRWLADDQAGLMTFQEIGELTLERCEILGAAKFAVWAERCGGRIDGNRISGAVASAVYAVECRDFAIRDNVVSDCGDVSPSQVVSVSTVPPSSGSSSQRSRSVSHVSSNSHGGSQATSSP